jgi:DNA polymerase-1
MIKGDGIIYVEDLDDVILLAGKLKDKNYIALDLETTGLSPETSRLFSMALATNKTRLYFNFNKNDPFCLEYEWLQELRPVFDKEEITWFIHNAKFDMSFLLKENIRIKGKVHCTMAQARVLCNDDLSYSLDSCAKKLGYTKDDKVKKYMDENYLWEWQEIPGKKKEKNYYFDQVPFNIISEYAMKDAEICYRLGSHQVLQITRPESHWRQAYKYWSKNGLDVQNIVDQERELTKVCFKMERIGVKIDTVYCNSGIERESKILSEDESIFHSLTGSKFVDSAKSLSAIFTPLGYAGDTTEKNNRSYTEAYLSKIDHPLASVVLSHREATKRLNTYFRNFLYYADKEDVIHPSINQGGTASGRFSCNNPNLQNLPARADDKSDMPIRRSFVPRSGYTFYSIDYAQMEYRMLLDFAGEMELIKKVQDGLDVHEATAQLMGVDRASAKNIGFGLLYGQGNKKLSETLGVDLAKAKELKNEYFRVLPRVQEFIRMVDKTAFVRGYIVNWAGRVSNFSDRRFSYKALNYLIQGGCADVIKKAMIQIDKFLEDKKSRMILSIHDELVFEIAEGEEEIVKELVSIMINAYPAKTLKMDCSVAFSKKSLADLEEIKI